MNSELITKYFALTDRQKEQFAALDDLYRDWNSKINVISRKDIDNLYEHHVLHSLAIADQIRFKPGTAVIRVCQEVSTVLGLENVTTQWCRAEEVRRQFHFVVSRAVMPLPNLVKIVRKSISREQFNGLPNGLICLKGGELESEAKLFGKAAQITSLSDYFEEEYFKTKKLVYLHL